MKIFTLFSIAFLLQLTVHAQYEVKVTTETYGDLTADTELPVSQGTTYHAFANFTFPIFNRTADFSEQPSIPSLGAFITKEGYLALYEKPGYANTIVCHALFANQFKYSPGTSKISAKIEGTAPNRIVKVQWKDLLYDSIATRKVSFQAWLHENDGSIAYHYGANTVGSTTVPFYCGMLVLNQSFSAVLNQFHAVGNPATPQVSKGATTMSFPGLTSIPSNGQVITFKRLPNSLENPVAAQLDMYPNPATDKLVIQTGTTDESTIVITDLSGRQVLQQRRSGPVVSLKMDGIRAGMYTVQVFHKDIVKKGLLVVQ